MNNFVVCVSKCVNVCVCEIRYSNISNNSGDHHEIGDDPEVDIE